MPYKCSICDSDGYSLVNGILYCKIHYHLALRKAVLDGIESGIFENGSCEAVSGWLDRFARYIAESRLAPNALSKVKIESRSFDFFISGYKVEFSIIRHPVGCEIKERWSFDLSTNNWELIEETILKSDYKIDKNGNFLCPPCNNILDYSPGRAKCNYCDFIDEHEHTIDSWR